jgi:glutaredoxin 3
MEVKVYTTKNCPYCKVAKNYLSKHNVEFREISVENDTKTADEIAKKTGQMSVPVIVIDDIVIVGFERNEIDKALGIKHPEH